MSQEPSFLRIFSQVCCADIARSQRWFTRLFGRDPDAAPMTGLAEWHHGDEGGLQLFENAADAGHGTITIIVGDLRAEHARTQALGLRPGPIEAASTASLVRLRDPDSNLVVLAQPGTV